MSLDLVGERLAVRVERRDGVEVARDHRVELGLRRRSGSARRLRPRAGATAATGAGASRTSVAAVVGAAASDRPRRPAVAAGAGAGRSRCGSVIGSLPGAQAWWQSVGSLGHRLGLRRLRASAGPAPA